MVSLQKRLAHKNYWRSYQDQKLFELEKEGYLPHLIDIGICKGTVVNRALPSLHGGGNWNYACNSFKALFFRVGSGITPRVLE